MKIIALSAEDDLFCQNRIFDIFWAKKYPGASWIPLFKQYLATEFEVVTADIALNHVSHGFWQAKDIMVIQHGNDHITHKLIKAGASPLALTCFESPLYIGEFYNQVSSIAPVFKHRVLFSGLHKYYKAESGINHLVTFPSYFLNELDIQKSAWKQRKFMVAVIGNKYVIPSCCPGLHKPMEWFWWIRKKLAQYIYKSSLSGNFPVKSIQLQDFRLEIISFFMAHTLLDLYGKGWDLLSNLPPYWQTKLTPLLKNNPAKPCDNKLEKIRNYKYGLCIENAKFPGYVTEKIVDCLVAGVIPLYMGAPNIEEFIPKTCFIDFRDYRNLDDLMTYLQNMPENDATEMIVCGQQFLQSDRGKLYSYEGFAEFMANIVITDCKVS